MSILLLARNLGLSISTVSRALNGYADVLVPRKSDGPPRQNDVHEVTAYGRQ